MKYLPEISKGELQTKLLDPSSEFLAALTSRRYERLGIDRALLIASDILLRTDCISGYSLLDVGCNTGLIGDVIGSFGNTVTGIDSGIFQTQGIYEPLKNVQQADFLDYLKNTDCQWDYILLLSVAHHWETGYAMSGKAMYSEQDIHWIFSEMKKRVRRGVYLEMPLMEPGFSVEFTDSFLKKYGGDFSIIEINRTVGTGGFQRRLFYLESQHECKNPLLEKILRNAHLYEKLEMSRLVSPVGACDPS